jgi:hypothetical protein
LQLPHQRLERGHIGGQRVGDRVLFFSDHASTELDAPCSQKFAQW